MIQAEAGAVQNTMIVKGAGKISAAKRRLAIRGDFDDGHLHGRVLRVSSPVENAEAERQGNRSAIILGL